MRLRLSHLGAATLCALALVLNAAVAFGQTGNDLTVTVSPVGGSGASATVTLTAAGNQTNVALSATGFTPGTSNESEIHFGTCANTGGIAFSFPNFVADAAGNGTVSTTVNAPLATLQDGNHLIHIHLTSAAGNVLACGDIPMAAAAAATATPVATATAVAAATATPMATAVAAAAATATPMATAAAAVTATPAALPVTGGPGIPLGPTLVVSLGAAGLGFVLRRLGRR